jgi:hypothetical protein
MKIIKRLADNAVIFSGNDLTLTADSVHGDGWYAPSFTTANAALETIPGALPDNYMGACYTYSGGVWAVLPEAQAQVTAMVADKLAVNKAAWSKAIDDAVLAIYEKPMQLGDEYKAREAAAQAYKDAGYTGTVPARVLGFSTPAGMTPTAATNLILSQAEQMRGALASLADLRMQKYAVTRAATEAESLAEYTATMGAIAAIAAALG